jgi:hypothetical protein
MQPDLRTSLYYHLHDNHYPPIDAVFIDTAIEAIRMANDGDYSNIIVMPNGIKKSVQSIIEELHLNFYLEDEEWDQSV